MTTTFKRYRQDKINTLIAFFVDSGFKYDVAKRCAADTINNEATVNDYTIDERIKGLIAWSLIKAGFDFTAGVFVIQLSSRSIAGSIDYCLDALMNEIPNKG